MIIAAAVVFMTVLLPRTRAPSAPPPKEETSHDPSPTGPFPATGRRVLVSGGSGGLGRALAQAFAAAGDRVAVHYGSRRAEAEQTLASLTGEGHTLLTADLADPASAAALSDAAADALGGIDVLVNNAATAALPRTRRTPPRTRWTAAWQRHVSVNLLGTANLSWLAARRMIDQGTGGRIVNVGSRGSSAANPPSRLRRLQGRRPLLGQSLAVALAPYGIAVTSVAPASSTPTASPTASAARRAPRSAPRAPSTASPPRGDRRRRAVARLPAGRVEFRHDRGPQRGLAPALVAAVARGPRAMTLADARQVPLSSGEPVGYTGGRSKRALRAS
ncbi:SDR family oxidoreductase [Streptomyces sp. M19]